jgi:transposase, IS5 family
VRSARLEYQILDVRCRRSSPAAPSSAPTSARAIDTANPRRVFISGQKRGVFGAVERELRRRSAIEPVIGHMKTDGHLGVCHLKGREGDAANVVLTAIGHNLRRVLAWQGFAAPDPARSMDGIRRHVARQMGFLTADLLAAVPLRDHR